MPSNRPKLFITNQAKQEAILDLVERDGHICTICKNELHILEDVEHFFYANKLSFDHIVPRRLGGEDIISNLQLAHSACNIKKDRQDLKLERLQS